MHIKSSITVENLAEATIVFSDKTGTLTKNEMRFFSFIAPGASSQAKLDPPALFALALCNTVIPRRKGKSVC